MEFLKSNTAKVVGACVAAVCGVLIPLFPPPHLIGTVASVLFALVASLGLVSTGVKPTLPPAP
jgi:hypothetical protein